MIDPETIAFDIDGVVADTMRLFLDIARREYQIDWVRYDQITCYNLDACVNIDPEITGEILERLLDGSYPDRLQPIGDAPRVLKRLSRVVDALLFVTARPHPGPIATWMQETLSLESDRIEIITTGDFEAKIGVLQDRGKTVFVEDRLETCFLLAEAGITPVLFRQPWNRRPHDFLEVGSWQRLETMINYNGGGN